LAHLWLTQLPVVMTMKYLQKNKTFVHLARLAMRESRLRKMNRPQNEFFECLELVAKSL